MNVTDTSTWVNGARRSFHEALAYPLKHSLFHVVNVKKEFNFAGRFAKTRDVGFKILLNLLRQVTEPYPDHFVIPFDNSLGIPLGGSFANPPIHLLVSGARANELLKFCW